MVAPPRRARLVAVGDELLAGVHPDLNSPWLAARLADHGWEVDRITVAGDDEEAISQAVREAAAYAALVIVSGGLGPTLDDVTRHGVARAAGRALRHSEEAWSQVRAWYERSARAMPASNERQALVPEGAWVLANPAGTAPGFRAEIGAATVFVLPGPPRELQITAELHVVPWVGANRAGTEVLRARRFFLVDLSESLFADRAGDWMRRDANPLMGVTVKEGVMSVKLVARAGDEAGAQGLLAERGAAFLDVFGAHVFSETSPDLARVVGDELLARQLSVTCAESCTGGLVAAALTRTPGISALLRQAFVTYSDEAKTEALDVPRSLLERHGAVSGEVAQAMARGAARRACARLAVAVTGIAGPGGGTSEKPVGLVWFGVHRDGATAAVLRRWPDAGRDRVRTWACAKALALLLGAARGQALERLAHG